MANSFDKIFGDAAQCSENIVDSKDIIAAIASGSDVTIKNAVIEGDIDLRSLGRDSFSKENIVIQSRLILERVTLKGSIDAAFKGFKFNKEVRVKESRFLKSCDFTRAEFGAEVEFYEVEFDGQMDFMQARFEERVSFFACRFNDKEGARFWGTTFRSGSFLAARFIGNARFLQAIFHDHADFRFCSFESNASFNGAEFSKADFQRANFCGIRAEFVGAKANEITFEGAQFRCPASFVGFHFAASLSLKSSIVDAPVNMVGAGFSGPFDSLQTVFNSTVDVSWDQIGSAVKDHLESFLKEPESKENAWLRENTRWSLCEAALLSWAQNFRKLGRSRDSNRVGYAWIILQRAQKDKGLWWKMGDRLLDIPSQRGTKPWRPIWVALIVIISFALVYAVGEILSWPFGVRTFESPAYPIAWYQPLLLSVYHFMPAMKPGLVKVWEVTYPYQTIVQIEILIGWTWVGFTAWSIRESFF